MHILQLIIMFILGVAFGGITIGIFATGKRQDDITDAFNKGKEYERMRINKGIDDIFNNYNK